MSHAHMVVLLRSGIRSYFDTSVLIHNEPLQAYAKFSYFGELAENYPQFVVSKMIYEEIRCRHLDKQDRDKPKLKKTYPPIVDGARRRFTQTLKDYMRVEESEIHRLPQFSDVFNTGVNFFKLSLPDVNLALIATRHAVQTNDRVILYTRDSGIQNYVAELKKYVHARVETQSLPQDLPEPLLNIYKEGFVPL
jgi:hypothetical protein